MKGRNTPRSLPIRSKGKSPAERSEEFTATQRRLKEEASARRAEAARKGTGAKD